MSYRVVSRFFDRARKVYVDPGAPCPDLDAVEAKRLVAAGCLVAVEDESAPSGARRRRDAAAAGSAGPAAPPAAPAAGE
jgi:hypothetical protein